MSLYGMMRTSVSGMAAQANRLATVADNIANSSTTGYKRSSAEFKTQVLDSNTGNYNSGSVQTHIRTEVSRQGAIRSTTSPTDLAIGGTGFFVVQDAAGKYELTRAGAFLVDSNGDLVNSSGKNLMGYSLAGGNQAPVANGFAGLEKINIGLQQLKAEATANAQLVTNLPSSADVVPAGQLPSDNVANADFAGKTSLLVYDNLGNERTIDVYFAKSATDEWEVAIYDSSQSTNGGFPYATAPLATQQLTFDGTTGYIAGGGSVKVGFALPTGEAIDLDMTGISQFSTDYQVLTAKTDGNAPASIERVEVSDDGTIYGIYQNGFATPIYQLALARVPSPDNLQPLSGNGYAATIDSGDVLVGTAGSEGFGTINAGALEESNVDIATELTIMIESQRSYTANSRVFQTGSDLMEVLVNLRG